MATLTDHQAKEMRAAVDASDTDAIRRINGTWPGARPSLGIIDLAERVLTYHAEAKRLKSTVDDLLFDSERVCERFADRVCGECHGCILRQSDDDSRTGEHEGKKGG